MMRMSTLYRGSDGILGGACCALVAADANAANSRMQSDDIHFMLRKPLRKIRLRPLSEKRSRTKTELLTPSREGAQRAAPLRKRLGCWLETEMQTELHFAHVGRRCDLARARLIDDNVRICPVHEIESA